MAKKDITLNARFSMLSTMRQHASQRQSEGRDSLLAQKRGWQAPPVQKSSQVWHAFSVCTKIARM